MGTNNTEKSEKQYSRLNVMRGPQQFGTVKHTRMDMFIGYFCVMTELQDDK